ncbi:hypothetical protein L3X38_015321 [Prunus dulcis]|uniref:Uncharacterized protein n=1 Tax=Prunus dulcis TaxID=3755 RepID=A0AAD4WRZ5_PRUDU|nr:hypothetical protein L3X38_015321 [Prunus dulcis]
MSSMPWEKSVNLVYPFGWTIPHLTRWKRTAQILVDPRMRSQGRGILKAKRSFSIIFEQSFHFSRYGGRPRHIPLLLGRPFLTTAGILKDVQQRTLSLRVRGESIEFKVFEAVKKLGNLEECDRIYLLNPNVHVNYLENTSTDVLKAKSPLPVVVKHMRTSLGRAGIYQCFIKSFSKMSRLFWHLLGKDDTKTLLDKAIVRKEFGQQIKQYMEEVAFFATSAPP